MREGPLDMRMDPTGTLTADEIVNTWSESDVGRIFREYGEEKSWRRAAIAIVNARQEKPITTTLELANILKQALPYNKKGFNIPDVLEYSGKYGTIIGYPNAEKISNEELLELECDLLVPAAKEDQINSHNARKLKCKIIAEGANGPTSANADSILQNNGILVIPDILANAGGVTVSYFEWVQDRMGYFWPLPLVNERLERMMDEAFINVYKSAEKYNVTLRIGAYILAIDKVAKTLKIRGIYA